MLSTDNSCFFCWYIIWMSNNLDLRWSPTFWIQIVCKGHQWSSKFTASWLRVYELMHAWWHVWGCVCIRMLCLRGVCMFCVKKLKLEIWAYSVNCQEWQLLKVNNRHWDAFFLKLPGSLTLMYCNDTSDLADDPKSI